MSDNVYRRLGLQACVLALITHRGIFEGTCTYLFEGRYSAYMSWVSSIQKYPIALAWLVVLIGSTLIFLLATVVEPKNFFANTASFFATMMGAGASGLVTFHLVDKESKRRRDLNMLWHYKSILDMPF